jgi:thiamine-phosphate pyrophosphorylase
MSASRAAMLLSQNPMAVALRERAPVLYLVTDRRGRSADWLCGHVEKCIEGGVDIVQLREKAMPDDEFESLAVQLLDITRRMGVPLVINDRVDIAAKIGAPSVHVGRKDGPLPDLVSRAGADSFIGFSIDADNQKSEVPSEAHLIGVGPIWATKTKKDAAVPMGTANLQDVIARSPVPAVAIGGVNELTIADTIRHGCVGACVVGELMDAEDPVATAQRLKKLMRDAMA